jgi:hypothetical protein
MDLDFRGNPQGQQPKSTGDRDQVISTKNIDVWKYPCETVPDILVSCPTLVLQFYINRCEMKK